MGQRLAVSTLAENTILRGLARSVGASKGLARWIHQVGGVRETTVPSKSPCSTSFFLVPTSGLFAVPNQGPARRNRTCLLVNLSGSCLKTTEILICFPLLGPDR